jgi:tRNA (guanine6-N2)-methyltransferase
MRKTQPRYIAHTQPGFETIAAQEIALLDDAKVLNTYTFTDKNGLVFFEYPGDPLDLMELRTIEDLFEQVLLVDDLPPIYAGLKLIEEQVRRATTFQSAISHARQLRPSRGGQGKLRFRVVARQSGETRFRRIDAQMAVEKAIPQRSDHRWQLEEEGALEFWLTLVPGSALLALRLSDEKMRHRTYKLDHIPASLRPSSAAALAFLSDLADNDVFLDPMCGAGTILIERANFGRYQKLLGGDIDRVAIAVARANVGPRYQPIELHEWDATNLPIDSASVTAVAVNLPFGQQIGSPEENRTLYPAFLREMARVMRPRMRMVALTADVRTLGEAVRRTGRFREHSNYPVTILGQRARILVLERS